MCADTVGTGLNPTRPCTAGERDDGSQQRQKTFTDNENHSFLVRDLVGNEISLLVLIDWIDKLAPQATLVAYAPSTATNQGVTVTLVTSEAVQTPIGWTFIDSMTFTKLITGNLAMTTSFADLVGNVGNTGIKVDWIDTTAVVAAVQYTPSSLTSGEVVAALSFNKTGVVMTNNGGSTEYLFTGNDAFTFEFRDQAGNT
ncbi:MAG: hypothetical protein LBU27_05815 [Candidatus Peribacteria bacterium]|jgi:hypothetical protein|nr:hypothetical protein [Candidatus Peribacteria bacterium]